MLLIGFFTLPPVCMAEHKDLLYYCIRLRLEMIQISAIRLLLTFLRIQYFYKIVT